MKFSKLYFVGTVIGFSILSCGQRKGDENGNNNGNGNKKAEEPTPTAEVESGNAPVVNPAPSSPEGPAAPASQSSQPQGSQVAAAPSGCRGSSLPFAGEMTVTSIFPGEPGPFIFQCLDASFEWTQPDSGPAVNLKTYKFATSDGKMSYLDFKWTGSKDGQTVIQPELGRVYNVTPYNEVDRMSPSFWMSNSTVVADEPSPFMVFDQKLKAAGMKRVNDGIRSSIIFTKLPEFKGDVMTADIHIQVFAARLSQPSIMQEVWSMKGTFSRPVSIFEPAQ